LNKRRNILICPLEWGLGHAARMIPMARKLQEMNNKIFIASGEDHLALFRAELPGLTYINFTGFSPRYSRYFPQFLSLLFKTPLLLFHIILEHTRLKKIIREYDIDIVISDNRFGCWNRKITSVYITHMPLIPFPKPLRFLEFSGVLLHRVIIRKYSYCFIPDLPGEINVSGRLSHGVGLSDNVRFIGILSRFSCNVGAAEKTPAGFRHNTVILSGPEPQREILKQKLVKLLLDKEPRLVILEGKPDKDLKPFRSGNIICYSHLPAPEMKEMVTGSDSIISRSGYTTVMELISMNCAALLIPTPGQTEQEYLAGYLAEKGWFHTVSQSKLSESTALPSKEAKWTAGIIRQSEILLKRALEELLEE
jgi:spore coat polysaccharide biosynthesis predicted glycosyltransferase SpsG